VQLAELPAEPTTESPATPIEESPVAVPPAFQPQESAEPAQPVSTLATPAEPTQPTPPAAGQPILRLSAGVALPQLLPEGTQIGVSVDYKVSGRLNPSARYALVVESAGGRVAVPVTLSAQGGTIQGFLPAEVRPEHKPFSARIEELAPGSRSSVTVSNRLDLQTSY
jgi:hypothetical protein